MTEAATPIPHAYPTPPPPPTDSADPFLSPPSLSQSSSFSSPIKSPLPPSSNGSSHLHSPAKDEIATLLNGSHSASASPPLPPADGSSQSPSSPLPAERVAASADDDAVMADGIDGEGEERAMGDGVGEAVAGAVMAALPVSTFCTIRRCSLCLQYRKVETLAPVPPPSPSSAAWTCAEHPDPSLASCAVPSSSVTAPLIRFRSLRPCPPYNLFTLGLLPFGDAEYDLQYAHPEWSKGQTLWLLERVRDEGLEAVWATLDGDVLLSSKGQEACEVRLLHVLAMAALYQRSVSVKAMPVNPFIQHQVQLKEREPSKADAQQSQDADADEPRRGRLLSIHEQQQHAVASKRKAALSSLTRKRRSKAANDDDDDADFAAKGPRGSRSSGRLAGQKRKRYEDNSGEDDDDDELVADADDDGGKPAEPEFLWKIEKVLAERQRVVPLNDAGQPVIADSSDSDGDDTSDDPKDGSAAPTHSPRKLRLHREHSTELLPLGPAPELVAPPGSTVITQYLVKIESQSYLHTEWHTRESLAAKFGERNASDRLTRYVKTRKAQEAVNADRYGGEPFDPRYVLVDRIIASDIIELQDDTGGDEADDKKTPPAEPAPAAAPTSPPPPPAADPADPTSSSSSSSSSSNVDRDKAAVVVAAKAATPGKRVVEMFLVKWQGLSYSQATWESAEDLEDELKIAQFRRFNRPPASTPLTPSYTREEFAARKDAWYPESPVYKGKNRLRDYQVQGLNWLIKAWYDGRNSILADEMGLGKTLQTVTLFEHLRKVEYIPGPFLVIVPLGTLTHWKREVETWTDMNVVIYHDVMRGKETREVIRAHEFYYAGTRRIKFNIAITTYEVLIGDIDILANTDWQMLVVDEGTPHTPTHATL